MLEQDACQWWSAADLPAWPPEHAFIETAVVGSGGDASLGGEDERKGEDAVSGAPTAGDGSTTDTSQRPEQPLPVVTDPERFLAIPKPLILCLAKPAASPPLAQPV